MKEPVVSYIVPERRITSAPGRSYGTEPLDVFWVDDLLDGTRLHVSAAAPQRWGMASDTLCGPRERWLAHVHPGDHAALRAAWQGLAQGRDFALEYRWIGTDGAEHRVRECGYRLPV